ncbi:TPA: hypothetical protein NRZ49_005368, partial [Klebsiella pneumoniae]|nr:hypothetical protein [Klebsiella pneumoniae]
ILFFFFDLSSPYLLVFPICIVIPFFYRLVELKNKTERDLIKSANDTVLFSVSALTTALLTLKTLPNTSIDFFDKFMINNIGYLVICLYTILLIVKAIVARFEYKENMLKYKSEK